MGIDDDASSQANNSEHQAEAFSGTRNDGKSYSTFILFSITVKLGKLLRGDCHNDILSVVNTPIPTLETHDSVYTSKAVGGGI